MRMTDMTRFAILLGCCSGALAEDADVLWRIGASDRSYREFSFDPDQTTYGRRFPKDVDFVVGASDAARDFSAIHPGPADEWAGRRPHAFRISFNIPAAPAGTYLLAIDLVDTHGIVPPTLRIRVNEQQAEFTLERGTGDVALLDPAKGKPRSFRFALSSDVLKRGENRITLENVKGSWLLYDSVFLQKIAADAALPVEISLDPTPFFVEREGRLLQEFTLSARGLASAQAARLEVRSGAEVVASVSLGTPALGMLNQPVYLPEATAPRALTASLEAGAVAKTLTLSQKPQRKWRIYVAPSTHTDIGYTDLQERVIALHNRNTDLALELIREFPRYHWNLESSWAAQVWFRDRTASRHDELLEASRRKRVGIESGYLNMLTGLCSGEELIRNLYYSARLHRVSGVPFESCTLTDAPSHVWTVPTVLAGAGIRYLSVGVNQTRAPLFKQNIHHKSPFWWVGPDGSRVLTWFSDGYSQAERIGLKEGADRMRATLGSYLHWWESRGDYPYDALLLHGAYSDNVAIGRSMAETLADYHKQYAYPQVILAANNDFFEYIEKNYADRIQTVRGCGGSWWEDGAGSSALETALNRNAHHDAVAAESAWALAAAVTGSAAVPQDDFNRLWDCILLYDEHTWGAHNSIASPASDFVTRQFAYKAAFAVEAQDRAQRLLNGALRRVASHVGGRPDAVLVFNPSGRARSGVLTVDIPRSARIVEAGGEVPQQPVHQDALAVTTVAFRAVDVPPLGYKVYAISKNAPAPAEQPRRFDGRILENEFYRVAFAPNGGVGSLVDKKTGEELVDAGSAYKLGQVIYAAGGGDENGQTPILAPILSRVEFHSPAEARLVAGASGPLFSSARSISKLPPLQHIELEVILYEQERRVDFVYRLHKDMVLEKEALYFAFPFAGSRPEFRYEIGGGSMRPNLDHFPGACRDWFAVQRWVTVGSPEGAVAWSPVDTPLITLCDLTPGKWLDELPLTNGTVFAYAMNNYWFTNYKAGQDGPFTFRYSLTSDKAIGPAEAAAFADAVTSPMRAVRMDASADDARLPSLLSLCEVQPASVELSAFKPADDGRGFIARIHEVAGREIDFELRIALPGVKKATRCDLVERDVQPAPIENGRLRARLGAHAFATYRFE